MAQPTMSAESNRQIEQYKKMYADAIAKGDTATAQAANYHANAVRATYGFSGGTDGDQNIAVKAPVVQQPAMSTQQLQQINQLKSQWADATAKGDTAAANTINAQANVIRGQSNFSGGSDGDQNIAISAPVVKAPVVTPTNVVPSVIENNSGGAGFTTDDTSVARPSLNGKALGDAYGIQYDDAVIKEKLDAATKAQFDLRRTQYAQLDNQFTDQMFQTGNVLSDSIRKQHSKAVATGASQGMQGAQESLAALGMQQGSVGASTKLALDKNNLSLEELQANALNATSALTMSNAEKGKIMTADVNKYGLDTQFSVGQMQAIAQLDAAKKALAGVGLTRDGNVTIAAGNNASNERIAVGNNASNESIATQNNATSTANTRVAADANATKAGLADAAQAKYYDAMAGSYSKDKDISTALAKYTASGKPEDKISFVATLMQTGYKKAEAEEAWDKIKGGAPVATGTKEVDPTKPLGTRITTELDNTFNKLVDFMGGQGTTSKTTPTLTEFLKNLFSSGVGIDVISGAAVGLKKPSHSGSGTALPLESGTALPLE